VLDGVGVLNVEKTGKWRGLGLSFGLWGGWLRKTKLVSLVKTLFFRKDLMKHRKRGEGGG